MKAHNWLRPVPAGAKKRGGIENVRGVERGGDSEFSRKKAFPPRKSVGTEEPWTWGGKAGGGNPGDWESREKKAVGLLRKGRGISS